MEIQWPVWGVPITFLDKYNPSSKVEQHNLGKEFEIVGMDGQPVIPALKKYGAKQKVVNGVHKKSKTGRLGPCIRMKYFGYNGTMFDVGYPVRSTYKRVFIRHK